MKHEFNLIMETEDGDLFRCSCGFQDWDFVQGKEAYAKHLESIELCNEVHIDTFNSRIFREKDTDPAYGETVYKYTCFREKNHEGDHRALMNPEYPDSNTYYIWPPKGWIDPRTYV